MTSIDLWKSNDLSTCLAEDVVFRSPLTESFAFEGRDEVHDVVAAAYRVVDGFVFDETIGSGDTWALFGHGTCAGQRVEESQLIRLNADGLISEITLYVRPLPAATALMKKIGPEIARRQGRSGLGVLLSAATIPLHGMVLGGEKGIVPLAKPKRV